MKRQVPDQEKIFAKQMSNQGRVCKASRALKTLKAQQPNFKIDKRLEPTIHKEDRHMANKHMKRTSLPIREKQIKTRMRYHSTRIKMAKIRTTIPSAGADPRDPDPRPSLVKMPNWVDALENGSAISYKLNMELPCDLAVPILGVSPGEM